jgi:hypothetical protein
MTRTVVQDDESAGRDGPALWSGGGGDGIRTHGLFDATEAL